MSKEQIIIDGVDVSGCVQFIQEEKDCCDLGGNCKGWTNCYYKQLKRKEQECKKKSWEIGNLGYKIKNQRKEINIRLEQLDQLKAELTRANCQIADNEILQCDMREAIEELKAENDELKDLNTRLDNQREEYWKKYQKLKQTLTEIKEIAEKCRSSLYGYDQERYPKQILQKISEVTNE